MPLFNNQPLPTLSINSYSYCLSTGFLNLQIGKEGRAVGRPCLSLRPGVRPCFIISSLFSPLGGEQGQGHYSLPPRQVLRGRLSHLSFLPVSSATMSSPSVSAMPMPSTSIKVKAGGKGHIVRTGPPPPRPAVVRVVRVVGVVGIRVGRIVCPGFRKHT